MRQKVSEYGLDEIKVAPMVKNGTWTCSCTEHLDDKSRINLVGMIRPECEEDIHQDLEDGRAVQD